MKIIAQFTNYKKHTINRDATRIIPAPTLVLLVLICAFPARAAETSPIKCGANEDRVWVYDSLNSFDVALKLKCGEPVEIISREKGYVKIRTSDGIEGYVPEKALPKPLETEENSRNSGNAQSSSQQEPQSVAAAARTRTSANSASSAGAKPAEHASANVNQTLAGSQEKAKAQPVSTHPQAKPATQPAVHSTVQPIDAANADARAASASQSRTQPASNVGAASAKRPAVKTNSSKDVSVSNTPAAVPVPAPAPRSNVELADNLPSAPPKLAGSIHVAPAPRDPDEEEEPVMKPLESSETCRIYFSAYGLSPNQYKWMTRNRGKGFSGICPAPGPDMVDFVVIFTHDVDFYNGTMPTPVHTDKNGFSDFTPLTTVDTAVVSPSDADKNRREYVWVFHTKRGTFDPSKFSPKRRPLFSTTESNKLGTAAGSRSAEDALRFMEQHGLDR